MMADDQEKTAHPKEVLKQELELKLAEELRALCRNYGLKNYSRLRKAELVQLLVENELPVSMFKEVPSEREEGVITDAARINRRERLGWIGSWASIIGIPLTIIGLFLTLYPPTRERIFEKIFPPSDSQSFQAIEGVYKILILPFAPLQNCTTENTYFEEAVRSRLLQLSEDGGLGLQVKLYKGTHCPATYEEGWEMGKKFNADLVVWGDYTDFCGVELEACVKYALVEHVHGVEDRGQSARELLQISEIKQGKLQGDIDYVVYWALGCRAQDRGNHLLAIAHFEALQPGNAAREEALGNSYFCLDEYDEALDHYDQAIELGQEESGAYSNRALAYQRLGKLDQAEADLHHAIELDPENESAYNNRGLLYSECDKENLALADFDQAIKLDPEFSGAFINRGNVFFGQKNLQRAIADFNDAIKIDPKSGMAFYNRGRYYQDMGNDRMAISDYSKAIKLLPDWVASYNNRGNVLKKSGLIEQAIEDYDKVVSLDPEFLLAYLNRGMSYIILGNPDSAVTNFNMAIKIDPKFSDTFLWRARAYKLLELIRKGFSNCFFCEKGTE